MASARIMARLAVLVLLALGLAGCTNPDAARVGAPAPMFQLVDTEGQAVGTQQSQGRVLMIDFMGTRCPPCRAVMRETLVPLSHSMANETELVFLSVDAGAANPLGSPSEAELAAFKSEFNASWSFARDNAEQRVTTKYEVLGLPASFVIDRHGVVAFKHMGVTSRDCLERAVRHTLEHDYDGTSLRC
jgi:thiol-disulfide isomerase/thioredoxin